MTTAPLGKLSENPSILAYMNAQHELPMKHHIALLATLMLSALVPVRAAENKPALWAVYGTFSIKRIWKYDDIASDYERLVQQAHAARKKAFLPAHPGHDNSGFRPNDFFIIPRDEGATLRGYLRAATDAGANAILLTSFNEWPETTVVEPSSSWKDPYLYLKIVAEWKSLEFTPPPQKN